MNDNAHPQTLSPSVWLPATILVLLLILISGAVYWLLFASLTTQPKQWEIRQNIILSTKNKFEPVKQNSKHKISPQKSKIAPTEPAKIQPLTFNKTPKRLQSPNEDSATKSDNRQLTGKPSTKKRNPVATPKYQTENTGKNQNESSKISKTSEIDYRLNTPRPKMTPFPRRSAAQRKIRPQIAVIPPFSPALENLPQPPPSAPLSKAPDPGLVERTVVGTLPVVGRDGRKAWQVYARPFNSVEKRLKISVVLYGLGHREFATRVAIQGLPGAITLAFMPYARRLTSWMAEARMAGHEVLMMVPMEPINYPGDDPGPQALLTSLTLSDNTKRLEWMLGRGSGYVGVTDFMGSRFTNSTKHMKAFLGNLKKRGLLFVKSRVSAQTISRKISAASRIPFAKSALFIDSQASRVAIDAQLLKTEKLARRHGSVVVMGGLIPVTIERVAKWAATVEERGFVLAPVSSQITLSN